MMVVWRGYDLPWLTPENVRSTLIGACVTAIVLAIGYKIYCIRKLPPGPWGLPFLGSLHRMSRGAPHSWYLQLCARYGEVISLKLGRDLVVCVGSAPLLKFIFNRYDSTGRPDTPLNNLLHGRGVVLSERILWRRHRQFLHDKFRALGIRNRNFEQYILLEIEELKTILTRLQGNAVDPSVVLGRHIHNIITQLMMSFRFEENDPDFITFNEKVTRGMELYGSIHIGEHLPWYLYLPGKMQVVKEIKKNLEDISQFHMKHIRNRMEKRRLAPHNEPKDLLDFFLAEFEKEKYGESTLYLGVDSERQIVQVMNDLFSAGMETSRSAILWTVVMMMREPEVAERVRKELWTVVAPGDMVTLEHRSKLVYVEAVVCETMRRVPIVPLGTTHVNYRGYNIKGHSIPIGTHLVPLLNKILMDPGSFPQPHKFRPERFIKKNKVVLPENFIPFGVGRRSCIGDQLARMEIFLLFANLMNCFKFQMPEDQEIPELEGFLGSTHAPKPFRVFFNKIKADV